MNAIRNIGLGLAGLLALFITASAQSIGPVSHCVPGTGTGPCVGQTLPSLPSGFNFGGGSGTLNASSAIFSFVMPATSSTNPGLRTVSASTGFIASSGTQSVVALIPTVTQTSTAAIDILQVAPTVTSTGSGGCNLVHGKGGAAGTTEEFTISCTGVPAFPNLGTDAATTDTTACVIATTGLIAKGSGTLGICLGTSSARYKHDIEPMRASAIDKIVGLTPSSYRYNKGFGNGGSRKDYWLIAEATAKVLPECVPNDAEGKPQTVDPVCVQAFMLKAMKEQQAEINQLKRQMASK